MKRVLVRGTLDLGFAREDEDFRAEVRAWLEERLSGPFAGVRGRGGPGDEHEAIDDRKAWERELGSAGLACPGWPAEWGGRGASLHREVIWNEEYARARAPGRIGHIGATLLGPTVLAFGTDAQKRAFLPPIARGEAIWCQGYSEPNAGSDLANVQTRAELVDGQWVIEGQKVWTSLAHVSDWCFVIARTDPSAQKHKGLSYLLVPMRQPGVHIRPIVQITGSSEFNEVFFEGARCPADHVVGNPGDGWKVAMGTLAFERGASTLAQQLAFQNELDEIVAVARENGAAKDPLIRQRLAHAWSGLQIMRFNALRLLSEQPGQAPGRAAMITKLYWSNWHRDLGELAMAVLGARAELAEAPAEGEEYALTRLQRLFLFTRSDTIYAGSNEIQRNIIGERALGLPPEPRPGR